MKPPSLLLPTALLKWWSSASWSRWWNRSSTATLMDIDPASWRSKLWAWRGSVAGVTRGFLDLDIKAFFDSIDRTLLMRAVRKHTDCPWVLLYIARWLTAPMQMEDGSLVARERGTPQSGVISPTLANLALDGIEPELRRRFQQPDKVHLARYCDDFIISGRSKELLENEVMPLVVKFLKARGLELSPQKTCITHIDKGFDFLGWNVRKYDGNLLIRPSKKSVRTLLARIRAEVKANVAAPQAH